uniref:Uncharacterized protein LOC116958157 n=1 Tax=Petromyzon marinus TaxID=7757 RepID=A0AAJ7UJV0_PETMA|nr:uncharacterized protein LOC116958157 [Petromyzon marinus]
MTITQSSPVTGDAAAPRSILSGVEDEEEAASVSQGGAGDHVCVSRRSRGSRLCLDEEQGSASVSRGGGRVCASYSMDGAAAPTEGKGHHAFGDAYLDRLVEIIARHLEVEPHHGVLCEPYEPQVARALVGLGCLHSPPRCWGPGGETGAARGATRGPDRALVMMLDTREEAEEGSLQVRERDERRGLRPLGGVAGKGPWRKGVDAAPPPLSRHARPLQPGAV